VPQLIYNYVKAQQQNAFNTFWDKAALAKQKTKEIQEGTVLYYVL